MQDKSQRGWGLRLSAAVASAVVLTSCGLGAIGTSPSPSSMAGMPGMSSAAPGTVSVDSLKAQPGHQPVKSFTLTAQQSVVNGGAILTYNGELPGPELHVTQGDRVKVTLVNHLSVPTTIHWHGVPVPGAEDGVPGLTQNAVPPGHSYTYEFIAPSAGTYWYHSHQDTINQVTHGLFGALVVEPPGGHVAQARDYSVILADHVVARVDGSQVDANGQPNLSLDARPGETVRLRVIDAVSSGMDGAMQAPILYGAPYQVVALDGHDLNGPQSLGPERLLLGMGRRADVVFTMPASGAVQLVDSQVHGELTQYTRSLPVVASEARVTVGSGPAPMAGDPDQAPIFDMARYGQPAPDQLMQATHFDATFPVNLSETPSFVNGRPELMHMINGQASPNDAMFTVQPGWVVRMHIVNNTGEWHPMHLHGHVFTILSANGRVPSGSPLHLDTVPVGPHETWDVAFVANNPGVWMLHCHVLLHALMGMNAMVVYSNVTTPYQMGGSTGNNGDG